MERYKRIFKEESVFKKLVYVGQKEKFILEMGLAKANHTSFSFTIDVFKGKRDIGGGANHSLMIKIMPELKKYIDLHLADENGVPMHAVENGYYYLENPHTYNTEVVANHFRINEHEAKKLQDDVKNKKMSKDDLSKWVDSQKSRWAKEAKDCIHWLHNLDDTKEYKTNVTY